MKEWTYPAAVVFSVLIAAIVAMFGLTEDESTRSTLLDYIGNIVAFMVGAVAGGATGGTVGFFRGFAKSQPAGKSVAKGP